MNPKPFIKWVGGKRALLEELHNHIPESFNTYHEPFVGGGALFFSLQPEKAVISDTNLELVVTYQVVKKQTDKLIQLLQEHQESHSKDYYYSIREQQPKEPLDIAARFIYLNKTCFNGLYRVNKQGKFNAPMGDYKNPNITQEDTIQACSTALQNTDIKYADYADIQPQKGDFMYLDPPYHPVGEQSFTSYTEQGFGDIDQVKLRDYVVSLHKKGVKVMLSNSDTPFIHEIYKNKFFHKHIVTAPRFVNCKANSRGNITELLITNY